ncbi:MAG TPA: DNA gyrase subunit A, partial [Thermoanaerobacterales bacterium]|nr:DNA gyrase subunit A [Thermoanaerobacterales bacterium]
RPHRKSARIVGDVLGKYHPHGDTAVYDAMVRLAQDFSTRWLLVDGHGNFGSIDGDSPAAMRYTEARLTPLAVEMLEDIDKETVNFIPNFDETLEEPEVMPSRFPNLLANGSSGIAVGMATNIPPHNLAEVIDGVIMMIENPDITSKELMMAIKGPDFPTGGIIMGTDAIKSAYETGRGRIRVRAKTEISPVGSGGRHQIIITEIPYQVNKSRLLERIADLVKDKKIEGVSDMRDESDRSGMRIVIETRKDTNPKVLLNQLYNQTQMQTTFGVIMLALVNGEPKILNLRQMIYYYLEHQKDIVTRRTQYDLNRAEARAHIVEGLKIALANLDAIIELIKKSENVDMAREGLMDKFNFTEKQAQAILNMRLQRLTALEREKLDLEYEELTEKIGYFRSILTEEEKLLGVIKDEILEIKEKYSDKRRTKISQEITEFNIEDLIEDEEVVITFTQRGYIKRLPLDTYKSQHRGGRGIIGVTTEKDITTHLLTTTTHNNILFFTNKGRLYRTKAYEIPEGSRTSKGISIVNLLQLEPNESITAIIPVRFFDIDADILMATRNGIIKKSALSEYETYRRGGLIAINLREDDELIKVVLTDGDQKAILVTNQGMSICFSEKDVRRIGRTAMGVIGIRLNPDDYVVSMDLIRDKDDLLVITENGFGKRTPVDEYRVQRRGGKGVKTYNITEKTGKIVGGRTVSDDDEVMIINSQGIIIRLKVKGISQMGRNTQGVTLMRIDEENKVVAISLVHKEED